MRKERKSRMFWVLDNQEMPIEARGYECPPNDDVWWFPSLGFSTAAVLETREAAVKESRLRLERLRLSVVERLAKLERP